MINKHKKTFYIPHIQQCDFNGLISKVINYLGLLTNYLGLQEVSLVGWMRVPQQNVVVITICILCRRVALIWCDCPGFCQQMDERQRSLSIRCFTQTATTERLKNTQDTSNTQPQRQKDWLAHTQDTPSSYAHTRRHIETHKHLEKSSTDGQTSQDSTATKEEEEEHCGMPQAKLQNSHGILGQTWNITHCRPAILVHRHGVAMTCRVHGISTERERDGLQRWWDKLETDRKRETDAGTEKDRKGMGQHTAQDTEYCRERSLFRLQENR